MDPDIFEHLSLEQQWALVAAQAARDALEPFHLKARLPEDEMPEFNRRMRQAILSAAYCLLHLQKPGCEEVIKTLVKKIPDYWEIPEIIAEQLDYFEHGPTLAWIARFPQEKHKIETWCKTGRLPANESVVPCVYCGKPNRTCSCSRVPPRPTENPVPSV